MSKFSKDELEKFPFISHITRNLNVRAIDSDYKGLEGYITEVHHDKEEWESPDNDGILEIVTDLEPTDNMNIDYPHLNGTSTYSLLMSEDMLAYNFSGSLFKTACGRIHIKGTKPKNRKREE